MDRNKWTKIIKERYIRTKFPVIKERDTDEIIYTKFGDSLSKLAYKYYNDPELWFIIVLANNDTIEGDSVFVEAGTRLRIPINSVRILKDMKRLQ